MKIGIDARLFTKTKQYTGISRSVYEILKCWIDNYPENEYYLFSGEPVKMDLVFPANWHIMDSPWIIHNRKLWTIFKLPQMIKDLNLDIYWGTNFVLPRKAGEAKYFVTVYDLALFKFKNIGATKTTFRVKTFTKSACKKAEKIIAISEATAQDVCEIFRIPADKVSVSYCGGLPSDFEIKNIDFSNVRAELKLKTKFLLFISTIEPRKNIISIVKAFEKYVDSTGDDTQLILAGKKGWKCDEIFSTIENSKYRNRIVVPGFISDDEKACLLSNASAFVYPSLYEGFGIPILEAFAFDLPVITARVSSLPEVAGDAAFYVEDPQDVDGLCKCMKQAIGLTGNEREELNQKMHKQLIKFSWEKNADEMIRLFEQSEK